jgi:hypothetical protein
MAEDTQEQAVWWGSFTLAEEQAGRWRVGPSTVWIYHFRHEWRLLHEQGGEPHDDVAYVVAPDEPAPLLEDTGPEATVTRFSFRQTEERLTVLPALADRAVIVRPEKALYVPEGESVMLYVSTPLWLRIEVGAAARLLQEIPSYRPSDTWFGPSTMEGELCYASRTTGRFQVHLLPPRLHRAITPIQIHNHAREALLLERMRLPVQHLSLFQASNDFLWTETVTLEWERSGDHAAMRLGEGAPVEASGARLLHAPRETTKPNLIVRPFSILFHKIMEA